MTGRLPARLHLALLLGLVAATPATAADPRVSVTPPQPRPGDLVVIRVAGAPQGLEGKWGRRGLRFFPVRGGLAALAAVDLEPQRARIRWRLTRPVAGGGREVIREATVPLGSRTFTTQRLTLPAEQVDLGAEALARVRRERAELRNALAQSAAERLWRGVFRVPVDGGRPTGGFGLRRIINGQPRSPHAGYDWGAPRGTAVRAANAGRVVLVAEHFFAGRLVVLDHGLGLFTLYFHLDELLVAVGASVARGQPIGRVGATGRATGPHLHFAVLLDGARVDPEALLALSPLDAPD